MARPASTPEARLVGQKKNCAPKAQSPPSSWRSSLSSRCPRLEGGSLVPSSERTRDSEGASRMEDSRHQQPPPSLCYSAASYRDFHHPSTAYLLLALSNGFSTFLPIHFGPRPRLAWRQRSPVLVPMNGSVVSLHPVPFCHLAPPDQATMKL